ncbi:MAG: sterol desaturase family protein [Burkholderiales bacterium]|nr:sterol desaturase family protein [Burkholderiales bacterium]
MTITGEWLADAAFHAPYSLVAAATVLWFAAIYALIAGGTYWLAIDRLPETAATQGRTQRMRPGQLREELLLSALSILIFAAQAVGLVWILRAGWLAIDWHRPLWHLTWELPVLYFWNELHFFVVHRLLHWQPLYRSVHVWHHRSVITTPFSAYSFHPAESFLLGTVMPLALVFHAFSPWALLGLTVMSLLLNVGGHLPHERVRAAFAFAVPHSRYHNRHHREFRTHYGFSFAPLDRWFGGGSIAKPRS